MKRVQRRLRETEEPRDGLPRAGAIAVDLGRQTLGRAMEQFAPDGSNRLALAAVAVSGMFADLIRGLSTAPALAEVVNQQIRGCGFELVPTRRQ